MQMTVMALGALAGPPISGAIRQAHSDYTLVGVYAGALLRARSSYRSLNPPRHYGPCVGGVYDRYKVPGCAYNTWWKVLKDIFNDF